MQTSGRSCREKANVYLLFESEPKCIHVIASAAKQSMSQRKERMDCFAEPVIGRRFAPTRWLAMTLLDRCYPILTTIFPIAARFCMVLNASRKSSNAKTLPTTAPALAPAFQCFALTQINCEPLIRRNVLRAHLQTRQ